MDSCFDFVRPYYHGIIQQLWTAVLTLLGIIIMA